MRKKDVRDPAFHNVHWIKKRQKRWSVINNRCNEIYHPNCNSKYYIRSNINIYSDIICNVMQFESLYKIMNSEL